MLDIKTSKQRFWPVILSILAVSITVKIAADKVIERNEHNVHLTLVASGGNVTARIDDEESFSIDTRDYPDGTNLGLYMYHSYEDSDVGKRTYFSNISVKGPMLGERRYAVLGGSSNLSFINESEGWAFKEGKGAYHIGVPGERGICIFKDIDKSDFTLEVDIANPVDAGVLFRASDEKNGLVFVARSMFNDAIFTSLNEGEPGTILEIRPFKELRTGVEALRVSGFIADLLIRSCLLLLILWFFNHFVTGPDIGWAHTIEESLAIWIKSPFFPLFMFFLTALMTSSVAYYSLGAVPHIADASAYLFQAKIFAAGELYAPAPSLPDFFDVEHVVVDAGKWFGKYPPLYPAILAVGVKLGVPWAVNPVLGALAAYFIFRIAREITDSYECGLLTWVLLMTSPFFLFISASMLSHAPTLLFFSLAICILLRALKNNSLLLIALAGASVGAMILIRPYTAFLQFWPLALYLFLTALGQNGFRRALGMLMAFGLGVLPFAVFYIAWNTLYIPSSQELTGVYAHYQENDVLGFGPDKGYGWLMTWGSWGHTPAKAFRSVHNYLYYSCNYLFGWPLKLSMAFIGIPLLFGKKKGISLYLLGSFMVLVAGHMLYWATQHIAYGARYWYTAILAGAILTAMGTRMFIEIMRQDDAFMEHNKGNKHKVIITVLVIAAVMWNMLYYMPERIQEGHNYGNISAELKRTVESLRLKQGLVFVKTEGIMYNDGFFLNDPFMESELIFARDLGEERNRELIDLYPEHPVYKWDKRLLTLIE